MHAIKPPEKVSALTINQVCGSGLRSVMIACQSILSGQSEIVIAGGQESMSKCSSYNKPKKWTKNGRW